MNYNEVYRARVNRFGIDFQTRVQGEREKAFENYLKKTIYLVDFRYDKVLLWGSFEPYKQDETQTLHYLLTETSVNMPNGTVLFLPNKDYLRERWMVLFLEDYKASGYNRYIMLKLNTVLEINGEEVWCYFHGPGRSAMRDTIKSRGGFSSGGGTVYLEDMNNYLMVMPKNPNIQKDNYYEIGTPPYVQPFRVMGFDVQSNPGVEYVTLEIVYKYDQTPAPTPTSQATSEEFFWFTGHDLPENNAASSDSTGG